MGDLEAQNGLPSYEETKALTDEKVPVVKVTSKEVTGESEFKSLTKQELMHYATDPFWVQMRWFLFILFWLIWLGMLVASVVIIVFAPKCPSPEPKAWWQRGPIYKMDLATFKDSDNDGTGDIKGLISELDYLTETGVNSIYITDFFAVSVGSYNHLIKPVFGTMQDWTALTQALKQRNIKVIIDLIPLKDINEKENEAFDEEKYTKFLKGLLSFWLENGVDGFNFDSSSLDPSLGFTSPNSMVEQLKTLIDSQDDDEERVLISLTHLALADQADLYGSDISVTHVGNRFNLVGGEPLLDSVTELNATNLVQYIKELQTGLPDNAWPTLTISGDGKEIEADMVDGLNMLASILPATPLIQAGDELGGQSGIDWDSMKNQTEATAQGELTHYGVFSKLTGLRHQETVLFGSVEVEEVSGCLVVMRVKKGNPGYLLLINFTEQEQNLDLSEMKHIAENVRILTESVSGREFSLPDLTAPTSVPAWDLNLKPRESRMFTFVPTF